VVVHHGGHEVRARRAHERVARDAREVLLHAPHLGDGHAELGAEARVGAHGDGTHGGAAGGARREGDAAALGELLHEEEPAAASLALATQHLAHGDHHV